MPGLENRAFTAEYIADLADRLRDRLWWVRNRAAHDLTDIDLEQFERPPRLGLLLAALNAPTLRVRAQESLTRVLRGLDDDELARIGEQDCHHLRQCLDLGKPHLHADFLIAVVRVLVRLEDRGAKPGLDRLLERTTISSYKIRLPAGTGIVQERTVRTFEGTIEEEHNLRRVRSAAHVACEQLRRLADCAAPARILLQPAFPPEPEELLRPASITASDPETLLRPDSGAQET